ncbi:hypothetical protein AnigIFM63604_005666, partial [Aspergillus niger]
MSDSAQRRPSTPITLPFTSDTNPPADADSSGLSSTFCPCCAPSPSEETNSSFDITYLSAVLEERLLRTLTFSSSTPFRIQAM